MPKKARGRARKKGVKGRATSTKARGKRREVNLESWIERNIDKVVALSGLDILDLGREQYKELLRDVIAQLYGSPTSYVKADVIVKRMRRYSSRVYPIIAFKLASIVDKLTPDQLEFVVYNVGDEVLALAPKLYEQAVKYERRDLVRVLRVKWANSWLRRKTQILLAECPRCGFNALTPDLVCLICGSTVSEKEFKSYLDLTSRLKEMVAKLSCEELKNLYRFGYILVNGLGIKYPHEGKDVVDIELHLGREELGLIKAEVKRRCEE